MYFTRRRFIRFLLATGSGLLMPVSACESPRSAGAPAQPAYCGLEETGKLAERIEEAYAHLSQCRLCPRQCGANRQKGEAGFCRAPAKVMIYSAQPHFGEEVSLVGRHGSGTIFFSHCNLRCVFCQNWPISHEGRRSPTKTLPPSC